MILLFLVFVNSQVIWPSNQSYFVDFNNTEEENKYLSIGTSLGLALGNTVEGDVLEDGTTVAVLTWKSGLPKNSFAVSLATTYAFQHGHFSARLKSPDTSQQPNIGLITSFFLYGQQDGDSNNDGFGDMSEMDFEFVNAGPEYLYLTTHVGLGTADNPDDYNFWDRTTRQIKLDEGRIDYTAIKTTINGVDNLTYIQQNDTTEAYPNFTIRDFHIFGMDWYKKRAVYWIQNDEGKKIILWEQFEKLPFVPMKMIGNMWWTNSWVPPEKPLATQKPNFYPQLIYDWMRYDPLEDGIDDYGYPLQKEEQETQDENPDDDNVVAIVVPIVVVVVVIIIVVTVIFIVRARNKNNEEDAEIAA